MPAPNHTLPIDLKTDLADLARYRMEHRTAGGRPDPLVVYTAYAQYSDIYQNGRIVTTDEATYRRMKAEHSNDLVNKFGLIYSPQAPMLLHRRLADVIIDAAIDMNERYGQVTVVMDGLRTYDSGIKMQERRPDLVASGLLARAGTSAHNRALAVDSKLFVRKGDALVEADEHGHLDDINMTANNRFYNGPMSDAARANRLARMQAWQRASVKNRLPIANLLSEFWDDRVPGSPADMWRVLSCRALCIGGDGNPKTNRVIASLRDITSSMIGPAAAEPAYTLLADAWTKILTPAQRQHLDTLLGAGGGEPPALDDFLFHEWLESIYDDALEKTWGFRQCLR